MSDSWACCACRTGWQLQNIEKDSDGNFSLFYKTPEGAKKASCTLFLLHTASSLPLSLPAPEHSDSMDEDKIKQQTLTMRSCKEG
jgi:hypothetical protein